MSDQDNNYKIQDTRYKIQDTGESRFHGEREREKIRLKDSREWDSASEAKQLGVRPVVGSPKLKFLVFKLKAI